MNKKGWFGMYGESIAQLFTISLIVIILLALGTTYFSITGLWIKTTENGEHTGQVTAIETNGIIFKTNSVYFKSDAESSQEDRYCVIDKEVLERLKLYSMNKTQITIEYFDVLFRGWKNCKMEDGGIIYGVKEK